MRYKAIDQRIPLYYIDKTLDSEDFRDIDIKSYLSNVILLPGQFVYLQNVVSKRFFHRGIDHVLGHKIQELQPDFFIRNIHPADLDLYFKISKAYRKCLCELPETITPMSSSLEMNFRIRQQDGSYMAILRKITPLSIGEDNKVIVFLSFCQEISLLSGNNRIRFKCLGLGRERFDEYLRLDTPDLFSGREMEVLNLLAKGYSSSRMANSLFVSINTVNTHRKSLMRKANVNKTVDLIAFAQENGYLD